MYASMTKAKQEQTEINSSPYWPLVTTSAFTEAASVLRTAKQKARAAALAAEVAYSFKGPNVGAEQKVCWSSLHSLCTL